MSKIDKILNDLRLRKVKTIAFVVENEAGDVQLLSYDENGLVKFMSEPVAEMGINEITGRNTIRHIAEIKARK